MESSVVDITQLGDSIKVNTISTVVCPVIEARTVEETFDTRANQMKRVKGLDVRYVGYVRLRALGVVFSEISRTGHLVDPCGDDGRIAVGAARKVASTVSTAARLITELRAR